MSDEDPGPAAGSGPADAVEAALAVVFRVCQALVAVPVAVLAVSSAVAFAYSCYLVAALVGAVVRAPGDTAHIVVALVRIADVALIGIVLFVAAVGLEELFLGGRAGRVRARLPAWLAIDDLNDLKEVLLSTLVLVVVVTFVDAAVSSPGLQILELGAASGAVVLAVAVYLFLAGRRRA